MPERIQRRRTKGWRMPPGAVYVGRGTKWGNPYCFCNRECDHMGVGTPELAAWHYRKAIAENDAGSRFHRDCPTSREIREELAGRDVACWCPPGQACHADALLEIANRREVSDG